MTKSESALGFGLKKLTARPYFEEELRRLMEGRGFAVHEIASALQQLQAWGFVRDERDAQSFSRRRMFQYGRGREAIRAEMLARGVSEDCADLAIAQLPRDDELALATSLAEKKRATGASPAQIYRFLASRGFDEELIGQVVGEP